MNDLFELKSKNNEIIFTGPKNSFYLKRFNRDIVILISRDTNKSFNINFRDMGYFSPNQAIKELNKIIYKSDTTEGATVQDLVDSHELETKVDTIVKTNIDKTTDEFHIGFFLYPYIERIENNFMNPNSNEDITIKGINFCHHTQVEIFGQRVNSVTYVSPVKLIVNVSTDDTIGKFDIKVVNKTLEYLAIDGLEVGVRTLEVINWKLESNKILVEGDKITKTSKSGWDQGAISTKGINNSNGYMTVKPTLSSAKHNRAMIGLSYTNKNHSYADIEYAFYFNNKNVYIYSKGKNVKSIGSWELGDTFKIELEDSKMIFRKNNIYVYHIEFNDIFFPLFVDTSIYDVDYSFENVKLFGKLITI